METRLEKCDWNIIIRYLDHKKETKQQNFIYFIDQQRRTRNLWCSRTSHESMLFSPSVVEECSGVCFWPHYVQNNKSSRRSCDQPFLTWNALGYFVYRDLKLSWYWQLCLEWVINKVHTISSSWLRNPELPYGVFFLRVESVGFGKVLASGDRLWCSKLKHHLTLPRLGGGQKYPQHYIWFRYINTGNDMVTKLGDFSYVFIPDMVTSRQ